MYRVGGDRVKLNLDGPSVEVEPILSWSIQFEFTAGAALFSAAESGTPAEYNALDTLYQYFINEARPQWDIVDHQGPVPATARGMHRLPVDLAMSIMAGWQQTFDEKPTSAVDALIPPGPANRELKRRLAAAKRRNAKAA